MAPYGGIEDEVRKAIAFVIHEQMGLEVTNDIWDTSINELQKQTKKAVAPNMLLRRLIEILHQHKTYGNLFSIISPNNTKLLDSLAKENLFTVSIKLARAAEQGIPPPVVA